MRAKEQTAPKISSIPDAQEVMISESSSVTTANGQGGRTSGGVHALSAYEAGWPSNSRGPVPSEKSVGDSKGNRSCRQRGQGVGEPYSSVEAGELDGKRTQQSEGGSCCCELQDGNMHNPLRLSNMSTELLKVAERARREPQARFHSLAHLIDAQALRRSYERLRPDAAVGVDGVSKQVYGQALDDNLKNLHMKLKTKKYRHQPIRRVYIPKSDGKLRPLGVSAIEDKVVQNAIREVLEAIYEQDFYTCSYGFRPVRSAHDAIRALNKLAYTGQVGWVIEADIQTFYDSMNYRMLMEMLGKRVADKSLLRIIGKCLNAGVLDGEVITTPEEGTPQGSILSPLLANVYLHYVIDDWFEKDVKPRMRGKANLIRYADDFVMCLERRDDAERVLAVLDKRMTKYDLKLHPQKTRLVNMERPAHAQQSGKGHDTFDFLGFTAHWHRSVKGHWVAGFKTSGGRLHKAMNAITEFCSSQRHSSVKEQHAGLVRRLHGWFNYFGINGNTHSLSSMRHHTQKVWQKWLTRRSQRGRLNWKRFNDLLKTYPLPPVRVYTRIW